MRQRNSSVPAALAIVFAAASLAGGCVDYLNHRDTITLAAGDAVHWNQAVHTVEHLPPEAYATRIGGHGKRTEVIFDRYWRPPPPPQPVVNVTVNTGG
jgi:hypothetical protein